MCLRSTQQRRTRRVCSQSASFLARPHSKSPSCRCAGPALPLCQPTHHLRSKGYTHHFFIEEHLYNALNGISNMCKLKELQQRSDASGFFVLCWLIRHHTLCCTVDRLAGLSPRPAERRSRTQCTYIPNPRAMCRVPSALSISQNTSSNVSRTRVPMGRGYVPKVSKRFNASRVA